jgi:hypothetical protein
MELIWKSHPEVALGSCVFRNVPVIIQYLDTPLLEVVTSESAGYTTKFPVFLEDGTQIAVVKGSQIYRTKEGALAKIGIRYEPNLTVFELENTPILELRRRGAAALNGWAELYAPDGILIRASDSDVAAWVDADGDLRLGWAKISGIVCDGKPVGIHFRADNKVRIGGGDNGSLSVRRIETA